MQTTELRLERVLQDSNALNDVAAAPGRQMIVTASANPQVRVWSVEKASCIGELQGHTDQVTSVLWSPDAARLVSAALDCTARVWQLTSHGDGFTCEAILRLHTGRITCMQFCADAKQLITGSQDASVRVWNCSDWQCARYLQGPKGAITAVDVAGELLAASSGDGCCYVWDAHGRSLHRLDAQSGGVTCCTFLPCTASQRKVLATCHWQPGRCQGRVLLWDLEQNGRNWVGQEICGHFKSFDTFAGRLGPLAFTNLSAENGPVDSGLMAMPCSDGTVQVMALDTYEQLYTLCPPELQPYDSHQDLSRCAPHRCSLAAFSPCGQWLATTRCSHAAEVHIWEAETGQLIAHIKNSPASIRVMKWVQVPPRGPMLAVGDVSGFCNLYTVFTDGPN